MKKKGLYNEGDEYNISSNGFGRWLTNKGRTERRRVNGADVKIGVGQEINRQRTRNWVSSTFKWVVINSMQRLICIVSEITYLVTLVIIPVLFYCPIVKFKLCVSKGRTG